MACDNQHQFMVSFKSDVYIIIFSTHQAQHTYTICRTTSNDIIGSSKHIILVYEHDKYAKKPANSST